MNISFNQYDSNISEFALTGTEPFDDVKELILEDATDDFKWRYTCLNIGSTQMLVIDNLHPNRGYYTSVGIFYTGYSDPNWHYVPQSTHFPPDADFEEFVNGIINDTIRNKIKDFFGV